MKTKFKNLLIGVILLVFSCPLFAQSGANENNKIVKGNHLSIGFSINQFQNDFGLGINVTSPFICNGSLAFRISENYQWLQYIDGDNTVWSGYNNIRIGVIGAGVTIKEQIRLYGEGGMTLIFPNSSFSSENLFFGGYGVFGFEFLFYNINKTPGSYFIELGGIGSGASADKVLNNPVFSNGFIISTGFRIYL